MDYLEELSTALQVFCSPKIFENVRCAQKLGPRLLKTVLVIPDPSLELHRTTQTVCAIRRVRLGAFDVNICIIESASVEKKPRQGIINPKQAVVPIERGRDSKGHFEMVDGLLSLALGSVNFSENTMRFADAILLACLWEETDFTGYGFLCGVELVTRRSRCCV